MERDLTCIILSRVNNDNLVAEIGTKYAKTVWDNLSVCCCAKPVFHSVVETFFSALLCAQLLQAMQMQRSVGS